MGWVDDSGYALRSLRRRPGLALFAAATLALGIGATTAMFSTLESVVLDPLPFEGGDRLVGLFRQVGTASAYVTPSAEDVESWGRQTDLFERFEPWSWRGMTLTGRGDARQVQTAIVRPSLLEMLGRAPVLGRTFAEHELSGEGARVLLLGNAFWKREMGGTPEALGAILTLDGEPWTVIGVLPARTPLPGFGLLSVDLWRPLSSTQSASNNQVTALVREGVTLEQVNERLAALSEADQGRLAGRGRANLVADAVGRGVRGYLGLLMGAVVLLLLISCVNVSNLLLFRANARRHETAVRAALGGVRSRLTRQLLIESLLLAALAGVLGVGLSYLGQIAISELRPSQLAILDAVTIDGRVLAFALVISLTTGVLFGLLPALYVGRPDALIALRSGARTEGDIVGRRVRWLLVSGEVALSFALLIGSLSVLGTLLERLRTDVGFRADEVVVMEVELPAWKYEAEKERDPVHSALATRLAALPGVVRLSRASGAPSRAGVWFGRVQVEGEEPSEETQILYGPSVDAEYFSTLGQAVTRGRAFVADDLTSEESVVILGESTARSLFGERDALGARVRVGVDEEWMTVVGLVRDVPMAGLSAGSAPPQFYRPLRASWARAVFLLRAGTGHDPRELIARARDVARSVNPDVRVDVLALASDTLAETLERERFATTIMATFAALALLLAAVGLYGVVSQVVGQRTREIGIRIALGARRSGIASMVLRRAGGATAVGIAAGIALALGGTRALASRVVGLETGSAATFILAAAALTLTSLLAAYAPARRATRIDPVDAMRVE